MMKWNEAEAWAHQVECQADTWRSWGAQAIAQARADAEWREWMEAV